MKNKLSILFAGIAVFAITACQSGGTKTYSFHTKAQADYLKDSYTNFVKYASGKEELSIPDPIKLTWKGEENINYNFKLYDGYELIFMESYNKTSAEIYNLQVGKTYKYAVSAENFDFESTFSVEDLAPRNLFVEGVTNCRDLGGWKIGKDKRVKQGLVYRTSKFNTNESNEPMFTENGKDTLLGDLRIKTEIDLRKTEDNENGGITISPLGEEVHYISFPMRSSGNVLTLNKTLLPDLLDIFADLSNYPIAFHCSIGTDRTGLVAFLINCLLGVSQDDLYRDYLFSNFGNIGSMRTVSAIKDYISDIKGADGNTLEECATNYLLNLGVKQNTIDSIKENLIENA